MNALMTVAAGQPLTMSTREIATLTGKEHRNVLRDARPMTEARAASPKPQSSAW